MAHEVGDVQALERALEEGAQLVKAALQARGRCEGDVLDENRLQPCAFARLRIDEDQHAGGAARIERMLDVRTDDEALPLAPLLARLPDRAGAVHREEDLDRMMRMRRHFAACLRRQEEAALP